MTTINFNDYFLYDETSPSLLVNKVTRNNRAMEGKPAGAPKTGSGYLQTRLHGRPYPTHRIIYEMHHGFIPPGMVVDHIDGDKTNNHIGNLRLATPSQNQWNCRKYVKSNPELPKGICECLPGYFRAQLTVDGKSYRRSSKDLEVLTVWLDEKRKELHGEFARFA